MSVLSKLKMLIRQDINKIYTMFPAKVVRVGTNTVDVKPKVYFYRIITGTRYKKDFPVLSNLPVLFQRGGNSMVLMPIAVDDVVLVCCTQDKLRKALIDLNEVEVEQFKRFDLDGAFVISGFTLENEFGETVYGGVNHEIPSEMTLVSDGEIVVESNGVRIGGVSTNLVIESDGTLKYVGGSRMQKLQYKSAEEVYSPTGAGATSGELALRKKHIYVHANNADESLWLSFKIPENMDFSVDTKVHIYWATPVTSGNCVWVVSYHARAKDESINVNMDGSYSATVAASTTAYGMVDTEITLDASKINTGDKVLFLEIKRNGVNINDTLEDVAYFIGAGFEYTMTEIEP